MIYERIKELREKHNLSQSELARQLSVTRSAVNAWEMGISVPTTQYIVEMSHLFKVSSDYILGISNDLNLSLSGLSDKEINLLYSMINYFDEAKKNNNP